MKTRTKLFLSTAFFLAFISVVILNNKKKVTNISAEKSVEIFPETQAKAVSTAKEKYAVNKPIENPSKDTHIPSEQEYKPLLMKKWNDGTRVYKVGNEQFTLTAQGEILHLPEEL